MNLKIPDNQKSFFMKIFEKIASSPDENINTREIQKLNLT